MEEDKIRTPVVIFGKSYTISGTETSDHMVKVAAIVDQKMKEINSANPNLNKETLAVLTAVNTVHDYIKLLEEHTQLLNKLKDIKD